MGLDRDFVVLPASDNVSTFRGEGVEPDVVALAVADYVLTFATSGSQVSANTGHLIPSKSATAWLIFGSREPPPPQP
jgi:hypothetical protein